MLNLPICTVIIMTKKKNKKKDKKKKNKNIKKNPKKKKIMPSPRFEPGAHGFKIPDHIHYAMEANAS